MEVIKLVIKLIFEMWREIVAWQIDVCINIEMKQEWFYYIVVYMIVSIICFPSQAMSVVMGYIFYKMEKHAVNIENSVWICASKCSFIEQSHLVQYLGCGLA